MKSINVECCCFFGRLLRGSRASIGCREYYMYCYIVVVPWYGKNILVLDCYVVLSVMQAVMMHEES